MPVCRNFSSHREFGHYPGARSSFALSEMTSACAGLGSIGLARVDMLRRYSAGFRGTMAR